MSVSEIINISRTINGRSMKFSQNLSNRYIAKVTKSGTRSIYHFRVIKSFPRKNDLPSTPAFNRFKD